VARGAELKKAVYDLTTPQLHSGRHVTSPPLRSQARQVCLAGKLRSADAAIDRCQLKGDGQTSPRSSEKNADTGMSWLQAAPPRPITAAHSAHSRKTLRDDKQQKYKIDLNKYINIFYYIKL
jgi:hypothetical protein